MIIIVKDKNHHKIKDSLRGEHKVAIRLEDRVIDSQNVLVRPKLGNIMIEFV